MLLEKDIESLARDHLDQPAEHVHAEAVVPDLTGLMHQRRLPDLLDRLGDGLIAVADAELLVDAVAPAVARSGVVDAGRVGEEVAHRDVAMGRLEAVDPFAGLGVDPVDRDLQFAELGKPTLDRSEQ